MLKNITGQTFGLLTVIRRGTRRDPRHTYWKVRCRCGKRKEIRSDSLRSGAIRSCGCIPRGHPAENISGQKFGRLTAICRVGSTGRRQSSWLCRCRCSREVVVRLDQLRDGTTRSCGCWYKASRRIIGYKHGHARIRAKTPEYSAYSREKSWCHNPNDRNYSRCGGSGVLFLFEDFPSFLAEVGKKPGPDFWLMRGDPDGNFEAGNLGWVRKKIKRRRKK